MNLQKNMSLLVLAFALGVLTSAEFGQGSIVGGYSGRSCLESEKQALLQFKRGLFDEYNYLSSWVGDDCCSWHGISCDNTSIVHVIELDLRNCSLRGNRLAGRIPDKIGELYKLESLDLSKNDLTGPIPQNLSELNSLGSLNLSFNDLSGRIPTGKHLETFNDISIYAGNKQLCGQAILKPCPGDTKSDSLHNHSEVEPDFHSDDERLWLYAGVGPGVLVGFLGFCASLHFIKSWRYFYFHHVEKVFDKIVVTVALLQRKIINRFFMKL